MPGLFATMMVALLATNPSRAQEGNAYLQKLVRQLQATDDPDRQWRLLEKIPADGEKAPKLALAVSPLLTSDSERVRKHALRALESFEADLELVRPALKDKSPHIRVTAAKVLTSLGIATEELHVLGEPIVDVIQNTKDTNVFSIAVQTLAQTRGLEDPTKLESALGRGYDYYVTDCLSRSTKDKQSARNLLLPLLENSDADVRFYACRALAQLGGANDRIAETLAEILPNRGAFNHSEDDVEELIVRLGPAGKRVMPKLIEVLGTDDFDAFPLNAFLSTGTDSIPHLKAGIVGDHAQYRIGCARRAAEFSDGPDAQRRELVGALMQFIESLDLAAIGRSDSARPDLWEALTALSQLHPDESVVPKMVEILRQLPNGHSAGHAAAVLGAVGSPAKRSLRHLMRLDISSIGWREVHIARSISRIEEGSLGLTRIKRCLRLVRTQAVHTNWEQVEQLMDVIAELGPRGVVLKDDLVAIVNSELMEVQRRIHAAYALARLFPNEPQWIETLESIANRRSASASFWAQYRLDQL